MFRPSTPFEQTQEATLPSSSRKENPTTAGPTSADAQTLQDAFATEVMEGNLAQVLIPFLGLDVLESQGDRVVAVVKKEVHKMLVKFLEGVRNEEQMRDTILELRLQLSVAEKQLALTLDDMTDLKKLNRELSETKKQSIAKMAQIVEKWHAEREKLQEKLDKATGELENMQHSSKSYDSTNKTFQPQMEPMASECESLRNKVKMLTMANEHLQDALQAAVTSLENQ
ncbi:hypothetical protein BG003_003690 [Podila horticola]|nr:hypothetical protein BG003_003690 [Podila horticola]